MSKKQTKTTEKQGNTLKKLKEPFDLCYFDANEDGKLEYLTKYIDNKAYEEGLGLALSLAQDSDVSLESYNFVKEIYCRLPVNWFLLPTSTTGKYHGGVTSEENSIGGNIVHTRNVVNQVGKVLHRYRELVNGTVDEYRAYREMLTVSCLLHDVGKASGPSKVFCPNDHGEIGASIVLKVWKEINWEEPFEGYISGISYAISNHMHMWKAINVFELVRIGTVNKNLILASMLCECDYYS